MFKPGSEDRAEVSEEFGRRRLLSFGASFAAANVLGSEFSKAQDSISGDGLTDAGGLTDVDGLVVGHFTDERRPTGCTVVLFEKGAVAGVDVRGAAPGTRETDLLNPINTVQKVHALVLTGGSAFGLETATGVMRYLEEHGIGFAVGSSIVPIVPAAVLLDLGIGDPKIRPDAKAGYEACRAASKTTPQEGNVGAGAGATVGKLFGMHGAMKSGVGTASIHVGSSGLVVAAIVAVNALGDVRDASTGNILAGARAPSGDAFLDSAAQIRRGATLSAPNVLKPGGNSTIGIVATNAVLNKMEATKMAQMAHDGLARTINPIHTAVDGDTIFAAATGTSAVKADITTIGSLAAEAMAHAVNRAVRAARSVPGLPAHRDLASLR
jgi:L-aminopeptidase/D-esterase-like protein